MARTWDADVELDAESAHRIVATAFPEFGCKVPRELGRGWDNLCILYPDGTVFRLPTRALASDLILSEIRVLPRLSEHLQLPIPDLRWVSEPVADYPYSFVGYPLLKGVTADRANLSPEGRSENVPALAGFLRALHSTNDLEGVPDDNLSRAVPEALLNRIERRLPELAHVSLPVSAEWVLAWARELASQTLPATDMVLVHGDLYSRHLLVHEGALSGVIDWGDINRGPAAGDLSIAYTFVPRADRERFFDLYGLPVSGGDRSIAQLRAAVYGVALTAYGADIGDADVLNLGTEILVELSASRDAGGLA